MEAWKNVSGYENMYSISSLGKIKSKLRKVANNWYTQKEKEMKPNITWNGYGYINLRKDNKYKRFTMHRLVAYAFIENPENKPCVNHIDGNKLNNSIENLEWVTWSENHKHAYKIGLMKPRGKGKPKCKLVKD